MKDNKNKIEEDLNHPCNDCVHKRDEYSVGYYIVEITELVIIAIVAIILFRPEFITSLFLR